MKSILKIIASSLFVAGAVSGCSDAEWKVKGTIADADGEQLVLESMSSIGWTALDTVTLNASGNYEFSRPAAGAPDIYRLRLKGQSAYFPIDSIETVTLNGSATDFGVNYKLSGTDNAVMMMMADSLVNASIAAKGEALTVTDPDLKRELAQIILSNPGSVVAYYIVSKTVGNAPLFNAAEKMDHRILGAVANAMNMERPDDPRTQYIKEKYLKNRTRTATTETTDTLTVNVTALFDINSHNAEGKKVSLVEMASEGNVIILNFTSLTRPESVEYTMALKEIYNSYKDKGVKIYQVSIDEDEVAWRSAAKNLPWTCVYNAPTYTEALIQYNVGVIPTTYIISREGELVDRVTDIADMPKLLNKYI